MYLDYEISKQRRLTILLAFRSMPIVSHIPQSSFKHFEPQVKTPGITSAGPVVLKSDLTCLDPLAQYVSQTHTLEKTQLTKEKEQELLAKPKSLTWATNKLCTVGYYHPIQPSHITFPKANLNDVLERLTECFRALSCKVLYEQDLLGAACQTIERVQFQVSLFETRQDQQQILLEFQRRAGDSCVFHQLYVTPIIAFLKGDGSDLGKRKTPACPPLDQLSQHAGMVTEDDVVIAIELATSLVTADRLDACQLGMESLETLTDTSKTGWSTALAVAKALIKPEDATSNRLAQTMLRYLLEGNQGDGEDSLAFHALVVWSNAWQVGAEDRETSLDCFCDVAVPSDVLMHSLMDRVEQVHSCPHQATLALNGLNALCRGMPSLRSNVSWAAVEIARAVGSSENAALEAASIKLLNGR
jgi:hypothetical protein